MTPQRRAMERLSFKLVIALLGVALACWLLPQVWRYLSPFLIALPLAAMIQPIARFLEKKLRLKHTPAVLIPVILLILILLGLLIWFFSFGIAQVSSLLQQPDQLIADVVGAIRKALNNLLGAVDEHMENPEVLVTSVDSAMADLTAWGKQLAGHFLDLLVNTAVGVPYVLIYINFLFMGLYFIAKDYEKLTAFLPHRRKRSAGSETAQLTSSAISGAVGYLKVQLIYSVVSLVAGLLFWTIVGNPYALLIAVIAGILEFIPLVGNGALYLPWFLVDVIIGDFTKALLPISLYIVLFIIRRLTEPKLMAHNIGISPLLSLISMFVGITAGGILGLIAGPVLMTVAVAFLKSDALKQIREDAALLAASLRRRWADGSVDPPDETGLPDKAEAADPGPDEAPAEDAPSGDATDPENAPAKAAWDED